ncbi:choline/glycine/proline betaine transport protein [Pseudomonas poae]|uniref:Choline/glycine/proline betaine transport protein n=3 Tax=Pseudomonas TaxID=286 RepID=A0A7Z1GP07_9PSED|nr:Osmo-dependent choline transporter BetT2 [Pseudomonas marginalis]PFG60306.1 choline/glycine/proline betaine transport protein [Pseudomonas poae]PUB46592.1 choline/glycine/proline betaine transport protein [Pseudomonas sp. GV047]TKJ81635.1 high-affinity choline transporter BetT [Pseudomonas sp. CFBP13509]CRM39126.1 High-affinity choline transport protein [Pseudomonas sp. 8 R 14]SAM35056.1 High-affinity choline transport protein [Pseudomonas sp. 1 R 17]SCX34929.1 choline/glycine/proline beta
MSASSTPSSGLVRMNAPVFYFAATFILLFGITVIAIPQQAGAWLLAAQNWAANTVGWYYMLAMTLYLVFVVVTALSGYGKIKLGADHDEPEFSYLSWAGMLFAAGISITLFFFCVSEPLTHLVQPPQGEAMNADAARQAMQVLFLHWGLHGWGVFAFVGMALAYFAYRHNLPLALRSALYPLIGKRINGPIGYAVDGFGIIATVFGLGADMGFGVLHLNSGLDYLFGVAHTQWIQVGLITLMMGAAILVAVAGVDKGVRVMSDINMLLACALLLFVLFAGPTQHLLNTLIQNIGDYLGALPTKSFDVYAYDKPSDWLGGWTVFYWAWWIAWSPFVGLFIARISRGRTIREFVFGVLLIPLGFTLAWMSIFGNSAIDQVLNHGMTALGQSAIDDPSMSLYLLLETYPWSKTVIAVTVFISFVFFVTSADSGTVVLSTLSSKGGNADEDGPKWLRVFWGAMTALVTSALLFAGSIDSLKSAVVLTSLPFSLILLLMMWGLHKAFYLESQKQIAQLHSLAPVSGSRKGTGGWRQRLSQAVHFPSRDEVYRFLETTVRPAIEEVTAVFVEKGLNVVTQPDPSNDSVSLEIGHGEEHPFVYQVQMRGYFTPSFARGGMGSKQLNNRRYYRAEVHLSEGSQDYDLVGYTKEQIINDILDQYERHLQFLHLVR